MAAVDFAKLRNQTLTDGLDSEVTVNTRALIDKVLARYSSEHTTLRELIQNASDAGASTVVVKFETDPSPTIPVPHGSDSASLLRHVIQNHTLKRLVVSNNGQPFNPADWSRLKSIADGNPDETKIGAFGVGFYSVFADCDEPFVVSGDKAMAFYWKGNTLSTKTSTVPTGHTSRDTTFSLDLRQANPESPSYNPSKLPNLPTLCQFLATSLTFVGLQSIEVHIDDFKVASFVKKLSDPYEIDVPQGLNPETEGKMLRVTNVSRQQSQIDAEWSNVIATAQNPPKRAAAVVQAEMKSAGTALKSFFSKFSNPTVQPPKAAKQIPAQEQKAVDDETLSGDSKGTIFLQVCTVEVATKVSKTFAAEIERATKKPPPRQTRIALLTSPYHDPATSLTSHSGATAHLASKIFKQVLPSNAGRIFIGFPTAQTTPFRAHVSAPSLIPTVERENVDMNARYIKTWNTELLRVAGLACRISYSLDMADIRDRTDKEPLAAVIPQAAYICKQYTAEVSHPSTVLGEKIAEAFFGSSKDRAIAVLSTNGVKSSRFVRMPAETLSFLGDVPMVPQELATEATEFFVALHNNGFISELTMTDIQNGLESRALSEDDLIEFLKWCSSKLQGDELDQKSVRNLFAVTVANIDITPQGNSGRILALADVQTYVNAARINPALQTPPDTIPFAFSKALPVKQLQMFGWTELSMVRWLQFLTTPPQLMELKTSEQLAMQVLGAAAKCWDQLDNPSKEAVVKALTPHAIMPTKMGLCRPEDSYFPSVKLFEDLPTVKQFPGSKDKFLQALGVRKTVDLAKVFERMQTQGEAGKGTWRHGDLLHYFASVINEIPKKDMERLRDTPFLPGEGTLVKQGQLFKAKDLYAPDPAILSLGLSQVKLPFEFKATSKEAALLFRIGLKQYPDSTMIASILYRAGQAKDQQLWLLTMNYFLGNYFKNAYGMEQAKIAAIQHPILLTEQAPFPNLVAPFQCYTNDKAACLGYAILKSDFRPHADKFAVRRDPDIKECVQRLLMAPPKTRIEAENKFGYLAARAGDLAQHPGLITELSSAKIVPIFRTYYVDPKCSGFEDRTKQQSGPSELRVHHYDPPEMVFVGMDREYSGIIDYVHYSSEATAFLLKVGAKHEPSSHDLASLLCRNPSRFLNTIGHDRYLDLLRKLSDHAEALWKDKDLVKSLKASRVLLGYRDIKDDTKKPELLEDDLDDLQDSTSHREWSLNRADEVVIVDDVQHMYRFRDYIIAAPQEEQLEDFYAKFGARKLTQLVQANQRIGNYTRDQSPAQKLRKDILERAALFLHEFERDASAKSIRHDAKWLHNNLTVQCVSDITTRYSIPERNVSTSSTRTATVVFTKPSLSLYVTPKYDLYDVSRELVRYLILRPKQNDVIALERILAESLRRLQAKGINVERILRRKEHDARIAKQQEQAQLERDQEEQQRLGEQAKSIVKADDKTVQPVPRAQTPEKKAHMPGSFGSPDNNEVSDAGHPNDDQGLIGNWAKKLWKTNTPAPPSTPDGDGVQISRDIKTTKSNIKNAIQGCRANGMQNINSKIHQDPTTQLDNGGYCTGEQFHNLHKAFKVSYKDRNSTIPVDIYFGKHHTETQKELDKPLQQFLQVVFSLNMAFQVDPAALNIFLDDKSNTVAFNLNGSLFFNLAWFKALHVDAYMSPAGRERALDSWYLTFCHELAHNLVSDHNARHNWYNQQIAIEYGPKFRNVLDWLLSGLPSAEG